MVLWEDYFTVFAYYLFSGIAKVKILQIIPINSTHCLTMVCKTQHYLIGSIIHNDWWILMNQLKHMACEKMNK